MISLWIFLFALAARAAVLVKFPLEHSEYGTLAGNLLNGQGFVYSYLGDAVYRSFCEPLYPFISAAIYFLTDYSLFAMGMAQAVFSSAIAVVIYLCARHIYDRKGVAVLAGLLTALHPGLIIYATKHNPFILDTLFICLVLLFMIKLSVRASLRSVLIAGFTSGLCILSRPTILLFLPLSLAYIFRSWKIKFAKAAAYCAVFAVAAGAVFLPWTLRNYVIHNEFMLTRSDVGFVFWLGNNPNFSGSALDKDGRFILELAPEDFRKKINALDELGQNRLFQEEAFGYIKKYPLRFVERTLKKFYYFWWFNPQAGIAYPHSWLLLYKAFYVFALIAGLAGIFYTYREGLFKNKSGAVLIIFIMLAVSFAQSLYYIDTRHRWAVEPFLLIFTAKGLHSVFQMLRRQAK